MYEDPLWGRGTGAGVRDGIFRVAFFSGYVASTKESAWQKVFPGEEYALWLEELLEKSVFDSHVVPTTAHRVLTLSTCSYEFDNARFVLHGILLDPV